MIEHVGVGDCSIRSFSTGPYQNAWDVSKERKNQGLGWTAPTQTEMTHSQPKTRKHLLLFSCAFRLVANQSEG